MDRYYRKFIAQSATLLSGHLILESEANILFYRGVPPSIRLKIKRKIPSANTKVSSPPTILVVLALLWKEFDEDDIDVSVSDVDLDLASDDSSNSDLSSEMSDEDIKVRQKRKARTKKKKKTFTFKPTMVPAAAVVEPLTPLSVDQLTKQMEELKLNQARLQRELAASYLQNCTGQVMLSEMDRKRPLCFICDTPDHCLGIPFCPEVRSWVANGLCSYSPAGRLM